MPVSTDEAIKNWNRTNISTPTPNTNPIITPSPP